MQEYQVPLREQENSPCKGLSALFVRSNVASKGSSVSKLNPLLALRDGRPCTQAHRAIRVSPHKACPKGMHKLFCYSPKMIPTFGNSYKYRSLSELLPLSNSSHTLIQAMHF